MAWTKHGLQISLKRYALSMEDKLAAGTFGRARNYGRDGKFVLNYPGSQRFSKRRPTKCAISEAVREKIDEVRKLLVTRDS